MRHALAAFAIASGGLVTAVPAVALTVNLSDAVLAGGVSLIGGGSKIQFDSQASGQSATFTLPSIPGRDTQSRSPATTTLQPPSSSS